MSDKITGTTDNVNVSESVEVDISREKMENEALLRENARSRATDPNDLPSFDDGVQGGWDGEAREGDPNVTLPSGMAESDASGEVEGGADASGGIDGGPQ